MSFLNARKLFEAGDTVNGLIELTKSLQALESKIDDIKNQIHSLKSQR